MCLHFVNVSPSEISVSLIRFGPNKFEQSAARLGVYAMTCASPALSHSLACLTAKPFEPSTFVRPLVPGPYSDWDRARLCHICTGTGLTPRCHICTGSEPACYIYVPARSVLDEHCTGSNMPWYAGNMRHGVQADTPSTAALAVCALGDDDEMDDDVASVVRQREASSTQADVVPSCRSARAPHYAKRLLTHSVQDHPYVLRVREARGISGTMYSHSTLPIRSTPTSFALAQ
jgi:hypothetical protein